MTEVAFHFNAPDKWAYACRLLRKAVAARANVLVVVPVAQIDVLDDLLWTFAPLEFVAHCRQDSPPDVRRSSPVQLATTLDSLDALAPRDVLLNLTDAVCNGFDLFKRVIEVVSLDEADRQYSRQRWKHYAELGITLVRHDLKFKPADSESALAMGT